MVIAAICSTQPFPSLDQLACINGQKPRHGEAKRLSCSEIDDQLEFGRLLDRHFAGFCPAQNLVHKLGCATLGIEVALLKIGRTDDIAPAFAALKGQVDAHFTS